MHARLARILQRYFGLNLYRVLARPLDAVPGAAPAGMRVALAGEAELLEHCRDPGLELAAASARASLARGDLCVAAFDGGRMLGYAWFAFGATPESDGVWIDFDRRATYSYRHFVRPEARGRRIAAMLVTAADVACVERGATRYATLIYTHNRASIHASLRSGARSVGYAACLRLFGRVVSWRSPGARREGLRFFRPQSNLSPFSFAMRRLASMLTATTPRN